LEGVARVKYLCTQLGKLLAHAEDAGVLGDASAERACGANKCASLVWASLGWASLVRTEDGTYRIEGLIKDVARANLVDVIIQLGVARRFREIALLVRVNDGFW
jgi:hypothetical protein